MYSTFDSTGWNAEKVENTSNEYSLQGIFKGNTYLEPNTTYYYRIAYSSGMNYNFLTALESFTTLEQATAVDFTDFKTEIMDYNKVKVSWTVVNPESESIRSGPYLYYANEGEEYSKSKTPSQRDEENNVVYYYEISPTKGKKLKVKLELEVAITDDSSKPHPSSFTVSKEFDVMPYIPPETTAVFIKDVWVEDITYNKLKVVWTMENPEKEYFTGNSDARPYLYYANEGEEYSQTSIYHTGSEYKDEQGIIIPNKYYYEIYPTKGKPLKAKVGVKVFRGETDEEITSEEITITPYIPPEISEVKMKDFQVEKIGHNKAKIIWTVENPEKEPITQEARLYYMEDGYEQYNYGSPYKDESGQTVPNKYYCEIQTKGEALKVYLKWEVFRGEENEYFKTEEIEINLIILAML